MIEIHLQKKLAASDGAMRLNVDLSIRHRELVTLYGPSGAGKTSILRMIAGLMPPDSGSIRVHDKTWYDSAKRIWLKPQKRRIGFVFQDYALFPHMTVRRNVAYACKKEASGFVEELLEAFDLANLASQKPHALSGGQKQRVAIARALARKPEILMLDEPLSALDHLMRYRLQEYLLQLHKRYHLTTILVSHDIGEVFRLSDRVYVLENGQVKKHGKPSEVFAYKAISGKFQFTGEVIKMQREDVLFVISVLVGQDIVRVIADASEAANLSPGDQVLLASKAFNPIIRKIP